MALEASEVAVRVRLLGGTAFQTEADEVAASTERIGSASEKAAAEASAASTKASGALAATAAGLGAVGSKVDAAGKKISSASRSLIPLSAASGFTLFESSKAWTNFQKQTNLLVTQALLPRKNLQGLRKDILGVSAALKQTPTNLALGSYPIVSEISHDPAKIMRVLRVAAMGANVGNDTVRNVADAISSVMKAQLAGQSNPLKIMKELDATVGTAKTTLSAVTQSFGTSILPIMKVFGGGFQGMLASVAALARVGVQPSSAFSRMRLTLSSVASPTTEGTNAMHWMHLSTFALSDTLRKDGLIPMLQLLTAHLPTNSKGQLTDQARSHLSEIFGKSRGTAMIAALLEQLPQLEGIQGVIQRNANGDMFEKRVGVFNQSSAAKLQQLQAIWQRDLLQVGQVVNRVLLPDLIWMAKWLGKIVDDFSKLSKPLQDAIVGFAGIVAIAAPAGLILGSTLGGIGKLIGGFGKLLRWTGILASADKVAAGENGVGGLSSAIKSGGLLANLAKLGLVAGVAVGGYELYKHRHQIGHFVANAEQNTVAGKGIAKIWDWLNGGAHPNVNTPAGYNRKTYIANEKAVLKSLGIDPKDVSTNALADPHFAKEFAKTMGEALSTYLVQHPSAKVGENGNEIRVYVGGKEVKKTVDREHRRAHNRG